MLKLKPAAVAREVVDTAKTVIDDFKEGIISGEESMTDRLVQSIRTALDERRIGNLRWRARTLKTASGRGAEEKRHRADVLGVLQVDLPEYKVKKGFLWQAKIIEPGQKLSTTAWQTFQNQCSTMIERTDESFAVIYSRQEGVRFVPAQEVIQIDADQVYDVGFRSLFGFFKCHVKCEIGDRRLSAPTIEMLDGLEHKAEPAPFPDEHLLSMKVTGG